MSEISGQNPSIPENNHIIDNNSNNEYNPQNEKLVKASMEAVQTALLQSKNGSLPIWVKPKEPQELSSGQRSSDTTTSQPFSPYLTESPDIHLLCIFSSFYYMFMDNSY